MDEAYKEKLGMIKESSIQFLLINEHQKKFLRELNLNNHRLHLIVDLAVSLPEMKVFIHSNPSVKEITVNRLNRDGEGHGYTGTKKGNEITDTMKGILSP